MLAQLSVVHEVSVWECFKGGICFSGLRSSGGGRDFSRGRSFMGRSFSD